MAFDQNKLAQTIWGVLLIAMGVLLCVTEPYALRLSQESTFLSFARYFIAVFLAVGGVKKLYGLYFSKDKEPHSDE
ncbi:MAG: hypothetical protein BA872_00425 [Desulfobacterales bacterium C00003060]|nr:MAG: hypothetical protein BA861_09805 [Desulfobacterales bacterium S3730MH5]OEU77931.1 MAG: hypothetical protein BA865_00415 [Desulfobacterales bacterium S5133MH4]OEU78262.1 MAG: hypothetical protein BA872_00425 [Desulfobacterales bacterium C00003060]